MVRRQSKSQPTWADVKAKLANFDHTGLVNLLRDLYAAHRDNRTFLHARFGLGEDVLRNQDTSVANAKRAIANYRKAVGEPAGLAELMVFYCEQAAGFCSDIGNEDENYFAALVSIFEQALAVANTLPPSVRDALVARLDRVHRIGQKFGYGVGDDMDFILAKYTKRRS